jgi:microcystin-dependent protein
MEPLIGQIQLFAYNFVPRSWALCNGQLLSISQNTPLFALIGTTFGGDGETNFALPKLEAPADGMAYCIAVQGMFPSRE